MSTSVPPYDIRLTCGDYRIEGRGPLRHRLERDVPRTDEPGKTWDVTHYELERYAILHADGRPIGTQTNARLETRCWEGSWCISGEEQLFAVLAGRPVSARFRNNTPDIRWLDGKAPEATTPSLAFLPFHWPLQLAQFEGSGIAPTNWLWDPTTRLLSTDIPVD